MRYKIKVYFIFLILITMGILLNYAYPNSSEMIYPKKAEYLGETTDLSQSKIKTTIPVVETQIIGRTNYRDKVLLVDKNFSSELPIILIDTGSQVPTTNSVYDIDLGYFVSKMDEDGYAYGNLSIFDNIDEINTLTDIPLHDESIKLRIRGNSSRNYDKKQYQIKILDEKNKSKSEDLLGMGDASDWILGVSFIDKSLLRNYVAYSIARELNEFTPNTKYCEVIYKTDQGYEYLGVSMLVENIERDESRVDIPQYSNNSEQIPFLMRRDRYNDNGLILKTYSSEEKLVYGYIEVLYPNSEDISKKDIALLTSKIDLFEKALFSDHQETFLNYRNMIDTQSFIDYFLINEYFLNYDAGFNSTYFYSDYSGKIKMGPVWDFDQGYDNNEFIDSNLYTTAFHDAPWFRQLLRDPNFTKQIIERYTQLRKNLLSTENINKLIDSTVSHLGDAIERDWNRWGYYYENDICLKSVNEIDRNTNTHVEEINKIKNVLSIHSQWLDENIDSLYQFSEFVIENDTEFKTTIDFKNSLAFIFIITWMIVIIIIQRRIR